MNKLRHWWGCWMFERFMRHNPRVVEVYKDYKDGGQMVYVNITTGESMTVKLLWRTVKMVNDRGRVRLVKQLIREDDKSVTGFDR